MCPQTPNFDTLLCPLFGVALSQRLHFIACPKVCLLCVASISCLLLPYNTVQQNTVQFVHVCQCVLLYSTHILSVLRVSVCGVFEFKFKFQNAIVWPPLECGHSREPLQVLESLTPDHSLVPSSRQLRSHAHPIESQFYLIHYTYNEHETKHLQQTIIVVCHQFCVCRERTF